MPLYSRFIFTAIIVLFVSIHSYGQYYHKGDYIITENRDTVFGTVQVGKWGGSVKLRTKDSVITYKDYEIEAWYSGKENTLYKRRVLPHRLPQFIQCTEHGKINVYVIAVSTGGYAPGLTPDAPITMNYGRSGANVYLEKEDGILVQVLKVKAYRKNKFEKEIFISMIEDIGGIKDLYLENEKHDAPDICYYIHEYNLRAAGIKN
jgi:hypothetical protein